MNTTPLANHDDKLDIMEHLNHDHLDELLAVANYYGGEEYTAVHILDIYEEGLLIETIQNSEKSELYIPFMIKGPIEEKVLYLAYYAMSKQGESLRGNRRRFFEVIGKSMPSKHMMRIEIKSMATFPDEYAAYAYGLVLKKINKPKEDDKENTKKNFLMRVFDRVFLWFLGVLSSKRRMKLVRNMNRDMRIYTLRFAENNTNEAQYKGAIDVYIHGGSPGGQWIQSLEVGDIIFSRTEMTDRHAHLQKGKHILIADETAYPAIAGILELWSNVEPPIVVILMRDVEELSYFKHVRMPTNTVVQYLNYQTGEQARPVLDLLKGIDTLDGAWGGLEREAAKKIRHYLRNQMSIDGKSNHIKGYWSADEDE
ncbi:MAG: SIP domain-containing protein [Pelistega sp.]|nr:SIP domain-containing protein [Pelistega sp.]